ncbi:hypothetical protein [Nitrosomonas europaea]|uniref:hypothetical protein n=2 Tax=Nitrosomonas europaea TaxID=915 RepID=UPI0015A02AE5|nr:hypothetical protein [Nitrosomonas europaea]
MTRMLAVPRFLSVDCYQDGVQKNEDQPQFSCCYKNFIRENKPTRTKEEEIAQAKESSLRSGNHRDLYVHVA